MTGIEAQAHWAEETKALCRIYQSLQPALSDLPGDDLLELSQMIVTDLVFRIDALTAPLPQAKEALTSISAICQSCVYAQTKPHT